LGVPSSGKRLSKEKSSRRQQAHAGSDESKSGARAKTADAGSETSGSAPRKPHQKRGLDRVNAILDAAASLIAEQGLEGLKIGSIARRAHTSIGSMYHFFPDIHAIIAGLGERHVEATKQMEESIGLAGSDGWKTMSAYEIADTIATPMVEYYEANPHIGVLRANPIVGARLLALEEQASLGGFELIDNILASHNPRLTPMRRRARSAIIYGALGGMMTFLARAEARNVNRDVVIREFKRALAGGLDVP
jgi:AcrR family transcriptional regulator